MGEWGWTRPFEQATGRTERYRNACMVKNFETADRRKVKFDGLVGSSAPARRTPGRTEILKRGPYNHQFRTAGRRKFIFSGRVGLVNAFRVNTVCRQLATTNIATVNRCPTDAAGGLPSARQVATDLWFFIKIYI
jgi:hypothetical protein